MEHVRIFSMFDTERDADLHRHLVTQASGSTSEFIICAESPPISEPSREERVRAMVREADEVVVLCGEHSEACDILGSDFRIVLQEQKPYLLIWGRREIMCTKPPGAKPADAMYSWTLQILNIQLRETLRHARFREPGEGHARRPAAAQTATAVACPTAP